MDMPRSLLFRGRGKMHSGSVAGIGVLGLIVLAASMLLICPDIAVAGTPNETITTNVISTFGTGRGDDNVIVIVTGTGSITTSGNGSTQANAISLGDGATITIADGGLVQNNASGGGHYGTGPNAIEVNSNSMITVNGTVQSLGTANNGEAINVHGVNNTIIIGTTGYVYGAHSDAIWFQDEVKTGNKNTVLNNGTIETGVANGSVIGSTGGAGIKFTNSATGRVIGNLLFSGGDDELTFVAGSSAQQSITGRIDGGGGHNSLILDGANNDTLSQGVANFTTLTKQGAGTWTISGSLSGFTRVYATDGILELTGDNSGYTGHLYINPDLWPTDGNNVPEPIPGGGGANTGAIVVARAQSLPTNTGNVGNIENYGILRLNQEIHDPTTNALISNADGTYVGQIVGTGRVEKVGTGNVFLSPQAAAGNTYSGGTFIEDGGIGINREAALGTGNISMGVAGDTTGTLIFTSNLSMGATRTITLQTSTGLPDNRTGGGIFDTQGNLVLIGPNVSIVGAGDLTKTGFGTLELFGSKGYTGNTYVSSGTLQVNGTVTSTPEVYVQQGARLEGAGVIGTGGSVIHNHGTIGGGQITNGNPMSGFTLAGDYSGFYASRIEIASALQDDSSLTGVLHITGSVLTTDPQWGPTTIKVLNQYGPGGITNVGIKLIDIDGTSPATGPSGDPTFRLAPDLYAPDGTSLVVAGINTYISPVKKVLFLSSSRPSHFSRSG